MSWLDSFAVFLSLFQALVVAFFLLALVGMLLRAVFIPRRRGD